MLDHRIRSGPASSLPHGVSENPEERRKNPLIPFTVDGTCPSRIYRGRSFTLLYPDEDARRWPKSMVAAWRPASIGVPEPFRPAMAPSPRLEPVSWSYRATLRIRPRRAHEDRRTGFQSSLEPGTIAAAPSGQNRGS